MLAVTMPKPSTEAGQKLKAAWRSSFSSWETHRYLPKWNKGLLKEKKWILYRKLERFCTGNYVPIFSVYKITHFLTLKLVLFMPRSRYITARKETWGQIKSALAFCPLHSLKLGMLHHEELARDSRKTSMILPQEQVLR